MKETATSSQIQSQSGIRESLSGFGSIFAQPVFDRFDLNAIHPTHIAQTFYSNKADFDLAVRSDLKKVLTLRPKTKKSGEKLRVL